MDRRITPYSGRVALSALRGQIDATFTDGTDASVILPIANLLKEPFGTRDRQVLLGDRITEIDRKDGHVFIQAQKDGYCGWLAEAAVGPAETPTHWIAARSSHLYQDAKVQSPEYAALTMGAQLRVTAQVNGFAETAFGLVPMAHLRRIDDRLNDPVTVAEMFLGTPYLWGGNSAAGLDCSGLVQAARLACGLPCPGDSDLQKTIGTPLADDAPLQRGDLIFWKGHVALVVDADRILHANGHSMTVAYESTSAGIDRIIAQGSGPVTARRRP